MNLIIIGNIIGGALCLEAVLMLLPLFCAFYYHESPMPVLLPMLIAGAVGLGLMHARPKETNMQSREGYVSTGLTWIACSLVGMLPFMLCGALTNVFDALFETISGFTTTGSSVLTNIEIVPKSVLMWRSFMHWIGGMGILVFMSAIMHFGGGSQMNLMKAESPGPVISKLVPKASGTARVQYGIYAAMTLLTLLALLLLGMPAFDAICITFGAAGTGGFGVLNSSCASYTIPQQMVITVAMASFGMNFSFYFLLLARQTKAALKMEEIRLYIAIILIATGLIAFDIIKQGAYESPFLAIHHAAFHVSSIMTTTGFAMTDINAWPRFSQGILVFLMICGACAGSTGGGFKISRILLMARSFSRDAATHMRPDIVKKVHMDGKAVEENVVRGVGTYTFIYMAITILSVLLISIEGKDWATTMTSVIATFNNIGPGLGEVGTVGNYADFSNFSKLVLSADMLIGRLEIFPILLLFRRSTWRKF